MSAGAGSSEADSALGILPERKRTVGRPAEICPDRLGEPRLRDRREESWLRAEPNRLECCSPWKTDSAEAEGPQNNAHVLRRLTGHEAMDVESIGMTIGDRYRLDSVLGQGGMGCVFGATDLRLDRPVAVKVIRQDRLADREVAQRFVREAKVIAQLASNPHILTIYDLGFAKDQSPFIVSELLRGRSLKSHMQEPTPPSRTWVVEVAIQAALALLDVHGRGITHGDIKPGNVFIVATAVIPVLAKLIDFGLSQSPQFSVRAGENDSKFLAGTLGYMAPELVFGAEPSAASDTFAFGVTLFELATGTRPYCWTLEQMLSSAYDRDGPPGFPAADVAFPEVFRELVLEMISLDPSARPSTQACLRRLWAANRELDQSKRLT